jgi:AraC-like DNA-binding protein
LLLSAKALPAHASPGWRPIVDPDLERREGDFLRDPDVKHVGALPSATGGIARLAYAQAKEAGIELEPLLKKAGLTLYQIEDPSIRIRVRNQVSFLNLAAAALHDDLLGFHLAQSFELREIGLLYYALSSSEMLGEALQRGVRYSSIVNDGISLRYIDGREVGITFDYVGISRHLDRHQIEFWMTTLVRMCRQLTGLHLMPSRVRLTHGRDNVRSGFVGFLGGDVEFGASIDEVAFPTTIKLARVVGADPYLNKLLISHCEESLAGRPTNRSSFRSSVENAIVPLLPHGKIRAAEIARRLGLGQRTFARRLSSEGLTFSNVLESLRSDLAERYLADDDLSISQIAWLLGYQEVSALTHAFKRWTGNTPRQARSRIAS